MSGGKRGKQDEVILLSINPAFAKQIYNGEKKFEFRKPTLPNEIQYILLLENGSRTITGGFTVGKIHKDTIETLWNKYGKKISNQDRFNEYYSGWDEGFAIEVSEAEKYDEPININELQEKDPLLEIPTQFNFLYMPNRSLQHIAPMSEYLSDILPNSQETTLDKFNIREINPELNFRPMQSSEEDRFRELFLRSPVPTEYENINEDFLTHIIESHHKGEDPYGYFTLRKLVYSLLVEDKLIGFTTTTWKRGGSVKYGPTMLDQEYRGKGYGPKLRNLIDSKLKSKGIRKTYSTIPEHATIPYQYLIKAGYKIEAHLYKQYSKEHSELVFGKLLKKSPPENIPKISRERENELQFDIGSDNFDEFTDFVKYRANPWYDGINDDFVNSVQAGEQRGLDGRFSMKGKRVYIGHDNGKVRCIAIASKKRGCAAKISPIFTQIMGNGLMQFLKSVEEDINKFGVRKLYTHVPIFDKQLYSKLLVNNYLVEGVIKQPYKKGIDMLVLGKMVE